MSGASAVVLAIYAGVVRGARNSHDGTDLPDVTG